MRPESQAQSPGGPGISASRPKGPRWLAQVVLSAVIVGFLITVIPGVRSTPGYDVWLDGVWQCAAFYCAAIICTIRLTLETHNRSFWRCLTVALYCEATAETLWFWLVGEGGAGDEPSLADPMWLASYALFLIGIVILVREQIRKTNASVVMDALIVALAGAALGALFVGPKIAWTPGGIVENLISAGYPILDLAYIVATLAVITIFRFRPPPGIWFVVTALTLWGISDFLFGVEVVDDSYVAGGLIDAFYVLACTAVAFGPGRRPRHPERSTPWWISEAVPVVAAGGAIVVLFLQDAMHVSQFAKWLALATVAAAGGRVAIGYSEARRSAFQARLAHTDDLTNLLNRRGFFHEHARMIRPTPVEHAVFVMDFDRFKDINDSLGHQFGDDLLRAVAKRITDVLPGESVIARFGGDEFVIAIRTSSKTEVESLAKTLFNVLTKPFVLAGLDVQVGVSIGIAMCPAHGTETTTLLRNADHAMFQSKRGGLPPAFFSFGFPERESIGAGRSGMELLAEFRVATSKRELDVHYQPIRHVANGKVVGAEALLRWNHPIHGKLGPGLLIPLAVRHGMMSQLTRSVLDIAVAEAAHWWKDGYRISVSVNISPLMFEQDDLVRAVEESTKAFGLSPSALVVEITEDTFISDYMRTREILGVLRNLGVRISLDDFGQGHSILEYLKELTIDEVKLDRSFIHESSTDTRTAAIVKAIISLTHDLGVTVVAEGVETEDTALRIIEYGADLAQGNFYCEPLSSADMRDYLDEHRRGRTVLEAD